MDRLTVRRFGNSLGFTLPVALARALRLEAGQSLDVRTEEGKLIVSLPARPRYTRAQLLAQCDPSAPVPEDMKIWDRLEPVGNETW